MAWSPSPPRSGASTSVQSVPFLDVQTAASRSPFWEVSNPAATSDRVTPAMVWSRLISWSPGPPNTPSGSATMAQVSPPSDDLHTAASCDPSGAVVNPTAIRPRPLAPVTRFMDCWPAPPSASAEAVTFRQLRPEGDLGEIHTPASDPSDPTATMWFPAWVSPLICWSPGPPSWSC